MSITYRSIHLIGTGILILFTGACDSSQAVPDASSQVNNEQRPFITEACANTFAAAANVSQYQDTHADLFPAYSACTTIEEWKTANDLYPNAIDGVDPVRYAMTVCANNQQILGETPICQSVNAPVETDASGLRMSAQTGLLGVPIPEGAQVTERTLGDPAAYRDPTEGYVISATASEIAGFFNRSMPESGWAKEGTSTETILFFRKGALLISILIDRDGNRFTLMGS